MSWVAATAASMKNTTAPAINGCGRVLATPIPITPTTTAASTTTSHRRLVAKASTSGAHRNFSTHGMPSSDVRPIA